MKFLYILYDAAVRFVECGAGYFAAAFSYYAPLALIPLLFFSVSIVGFFYGDAFANQVFSSWGAAMGNDLVKIIQLAVSNLHSETETSKITFIGSIFFLSFYIIALNIMSDGFQKLWGTESKGIKGWLLKSFRSIGFLFILQVYLIFVVGLEYFIAPTIFGASSLLTSIILFGSTTVFFAVLFKLLAKRSPSWTGCFVGGVVSSLLFMAIKFLVDFYIATTPVLSLYGAAGLILILLVWIYVLAAFIFYGAAVAGVYDKMVKANFIRK